MPLITDDMLYTHQAGAERRDAVAYARERLPLAVAEFILAKFERSFLDGPRRMLLDELRGLVDTINIDGR